ncbi:MAG: hypothetical protein ACOYLH_12515, partial [Flavobacteriales bacterium]
MKKIFTSVIALSIAAITTNAQNSGDLDISFATDGMYSTDFGFHDNITDVKVDPSTGKTIAVGTAITPEYAGKLLVMRLNEDGTPDNTFSDDGTVIIEDYNESYAYDCHIFSDGSMLVAGAVADDNYVFSMIVLKLQSDGSLDPDFGTDGIAIPSIGVGDDFAQALAVSATGNIYLAGKSINEVYQNVPSIYALDSDGNPLTSFGTDGLVQIPVISEDNIFNALAFDGSNRLVACGHYGYPLTVTGQTNFDILVARFNIDGSLDETFSTDGVATIAISAEYIEDAFGLAILDNQIFASGYTTLPDFSFDAVIVALTNEGTLDASFAEDGIYTYNQNVQDVFLDLHLDQNEKLVACGTTGGFFFDFREFLLSRVDLTGTLDNSFGTDGIVTTSVGSTYSEANTFAFKANGAIIAGGKSNAGGNNDAAFAQYHASAGVSVSEISAVTILVYPNPAKSGASIQLSDKDAQVLSSAHLFALNGAKINLTLSQNHQVIQLPSLSAGIY